MESHPVVCIFILLSVTLAPASAAEITGNATAWVWEGETAFLNCSTQLANALFVWHVDGDVLPGDPRYSLLYDPLGPFSTLLISPVFSNDTGSNYTCLVTNNTINETSNSVQLRVAKPPDSERVYCKAEAYTGGLSLICSWTGGQPAADVELSFNGIVDKGKDMVNRTVILDDKLQNQQFICQGNQVGKISECSITLEPPLSSSHKNDTVTSLTEGGIANLTVRLTSQNYFTPEFSWFHINPEDVNITSGGKYNVESSDSGSTLLISGVTKNEGGTYECRVRNSIGSTTFMFSLEVISQGSSGLSGGAIAGIVIGVLAGVVLIGVLVFFLVKKLK